MTYQDLADGAVIVVMAGFLIVGVLMIFMFIAMMIIAA
jgi:hypothetical protein